MLSIKESYELFEEIGCFAEYGKIGSASHYDAYHGL